MSISLCQISHSLRFTKFNALPFIGVFQGRSKINTFAFEKIGRKEHMKNIAILASGEGSNAMNIIQHFSASEKAVVVLVLSNRGDAPIVEKAVMAGIPVMVLAKKGEFSTPSLIQFLKKQKIDLIVLAGFLLLLPEDLIKAFPKKIINIHPALLPKYGGKGMYGNKVHEKVISAKEKESGISIHYVNENFDEGELIAQFKCVVDSSDTIESLSKKIHQLEMEHFPRVVEKIIS